MTINLDRLMKAEKAKRSDIPNILEDCDPIQLAFIKDPAKRKGLCGTRRSRKSFTLAFNLINQALTVPKSKCIYFALTNESAKQIMWSDIIDVIFTKYNIKAICTSKNEIEFSNGSIIYLRGLDATPHQMARVRGQKFDIAVIDEVQDFTQNLVDIIDGVLRMSLAQTAATLILAGTPCSTILTNHFWWKIWKPQTELTEWKLFKFHWQENHHIEPKSGLRVCDAIQADMDLQLKSNPLKIDDPIFRREVLGEWVIDLTTLVYKYNPIINDFADNSQFLTRIGDKGWTSILGIDFGWEDADALVTLAFHKYDPNVYVIESEKHNHWTITQLANRIAELHKLYHYSHMVADSANAKDIAEIRIHHHLPLEAAEKQGKAGFIQLLNADLSTGNIKINTRTNEALIKELQELVWDDKKLNEGILKEKDSKDNHLTDAFLYAYRKSRHFNNQPVPMKIDFANVKTPQDTYQLLKETGMLPKPQSESRINRSGGSIFSNQSNAEVIALFRQQQRELTK